LNLLEAIRAVFGKDLSNKRFYQASSSEMFGKVIESPQTETTRFWPRSPYGVAKVFGHQITVNYRESYGLFACSGILFNHESPRRDPKFVTRKISLGVSRIAQGSTEPIHLGNLEARRDWGFAGDYVVAMHQMLNADEPRDLVIATGKTWSIEELLEKAFARAGITSWRKYVVEDPAFKRPAEVDLLLGDSTHAQEFLGWRPTVQFDDLVNMMVDWDLNNRG
jgi:GDPmannose 4,6-dehydratase